MLVPAGIAPGLLALALDILLGLKANINDYIGGRRDLKAE
jgi:hypothetical protein